MTREVLLLIFIALTVVLIGLGIWAWLRRRRRDSGLPAPFAELPEGATTTAVFAGFYVATTRHGEPLERLAVRGLAFRSRVAITVTDIGVALDLTGQPRMFLPATQIRGVAQATVAIDRVVEKDGLVRLTWPAGDQLVDSYLRPQDDSARALADAITGILPISAPETTPTGTDA
ncbi:hypothetical protein [Microbacterium invictum]|uniref:PH domain-containing protein n=1 Tax=Microbacterium invictum TaxID=515415 RepID=A0AA40VLU2_9MICO|nr:MULTISPECIES: hypothetical protein [Microbacterium]MBB4139187.1 hypothetical protein [Microbacterium invictum]